MLKLESKQDNTRELRIRDELDDDQEVELSFYNNNTKDRIYLYFNKPQLTMLKNHIKDLLKNEDKS